MTTTDTPPDDQERLHVQTLPLPLVLLHPIEIQRLSGLGSNGSQPTAVSLRLPRVLSEYSLAIAQSMRVSRNSLFNALLARAVTDLIRDQRLSLDPTPLAAYLDPSIEIPKVKAQS